MNAVDVNKLTFCYHNTKVLDNLSFHVKKGGHIYGLLGPNGSGKTTLLKCINGLRKPLSGEIMIMGKPLCMMQKQEVARKISTVPQQTNLIFPFKAIEVVVMGKSPYLGYWNIPGKDDYKRAFNIMENLGISSLAERSFNEISGGEKQMVLIARAIFQNAEIMLLDEPTAHLDYKNQFVIMDLIKKVAREKERTVIITLHDPNLAMHYCDEVLMLKKGKIISAGKTSEVFQVHTLRQMYETNIHIDVTSNGFSVVIPGDW